MYECPWKIIKIKVNWQEKVFYKQTYFARFQISSFTNASKGTEIASLFFKDFII